ncbi:hypothetical protein K402DRAFT_398846 [Aulographum hederae CBS 113979]|uniref:Uncharacterized protein n=1 Tax=Aulographum hederae CBS 113979 TaxID=1176131 RepID=A0A6G1GK64_9PEZI|nr:hypothetical protein K402DRAFT_398846 [Aulographum hederae CBS 113979]
MNNQENFDRRSKRLADRGRSELPESTQGETNQQPEDPDLSDQELDSVGPSVMVSSLWLVPLPIQEMCLC